MFSFWVSVTLTFDLWPSRSLSDLQIWVSMLWPSFVDIGVTLVVWEHFQIFRFLHHRDLDLLPMTLKKAEWLTNLCVYVVTQFHRHWGKIALLRKYLFLFSMTLTLSFNIWILNVACLFSTIMRIISIIDWVNICNIDRMRALRKFSACGSL